MPTRLSQNFFAALLGLIFLIPMAAHAQTPSEGASVSSSAPFAATGGIAPDQDNPGFDVQKFENPLLPGIGLCNPLLLNFFCELDPRKNPAESYGYKVLNYVLSFTGLFMVIILIYGGARSLFAFGDPKAAEQGHKAIMAAIIGFVILTLSYAATVTILHIAKK